MRDPLVVPLAAVAAGAVASRLLTFSQTELLLALCGFAALSVVAKRYSSFRLALTCCCLAFAAAGALLHLLHQPGPPPRIEADSDEVVILSGCVVEPPILSPDREQFVLEIEKGARARVSLYLREGQAPPQLAYGQRVEFEARIRQPRNYRNPGSFDYQGYLARRQIYWTASVPTGAPINVQPGQCGNDMQKAIFALRGMALRRISDHFPGDNYGSAMLRAILIGESGGLERAWTEHFRRTGTYHALVISGLHVGVLASVLLLLLRVMMIGELPSLAITAAAAWLYALVSGGAVPVTRAASGFTLYLIARYFYRESRLLNLISAVALGFLLCDPDQLFEASFQLSFLSVAAIAVLAVPVMDRWTSPFSRGLAGLADPDRDLHLEPRVAQFRVELRLIAETLALWLRLPISWAAAAISRLLRAFYYLLHLAVISCAVQIGLMLPMLYYFHRVSLSGLTANLLVVPAMSLVVPFGFAAIFTGWYLPAAIARQLLRFSAWVVEFHAEWEPVLRIPSPPFWIAIGYAAALLLALLPGRFRFWRTLPALAMVAALVRHPVRPSIAPGELELTAIDVGQGESLFIALPSGKLLLMDGGGIPSYGRKSKPRLDIGEDVVAPYLWSRSIRRVDVIALSHAHEDHAGGLPALIENFRPAELWTSGLPESQTAIAGAARRAGTKILTFAAGQRIDYGGLTFDVLSPPPDYEFAQAGKNDDSLVLRVRYGAHTFLLTGDIEKRMEQRLLEGGELGRIDVLKVAHHGSRTSTASQFVEATRPLFALISAGAANSYRHPHTQVVENLSSRGAAILRTDLSGLVTVRSDGKRFTIDTAQWAASAQSLESPF